MKIKDIQEEIIDEFGIFDSWMDKYEYIIELGKNVPKINEDDKVDENIIKGCQSKVWLHAKKSKGLVQFYADSDALITKGIISLLLRVLSNQKPSDIIQANLDFIDKIGLRQHLSVNKSNGLNNMIKKIKFYAIFYKKKKMSKEFDPNIMGEKIIKVIKTIYDPEIPVDIYELGLIYDIMINENFDVKIIMTLTSPNCPVAETLPVDVEEKVKTVEGVKSATVEITFEPAWNKELMSDEAKLELGML